MFKLLEVKRVCASHRPTLEVDFGDSYDIALNRQVTYLEKLKCVRSKTNPTGEMSAILFQSPVLLLKYLSSRAISLESLVTLLNNPDSLSLKEVRCMDRLFSQYILIVEQMTHESLLMYQDLNSIRDYRNCVQNALLLSKRNNLSDLNENIKLIISNATRLMSQPKQKNIFEYTNIDVSSVYSKLIA